jgi:hypothetical protein
MRSLIQELPEGRFRAAIRPEERLLLAVVESAFWDLRSPDPVRRRTARSYFLEETDDHTFSFVSICQHFSWSPASIRGQLGEMLSTLTGTGAWSFAADVKPSRVRSGR